MGHPSLRAAVAQILQQVESGESLSQLLPQWQHRVSVDDASALQALSFGVCRRFFSLSDELKHRLRKPLKKNDRLIQYLLLTGLFQLRFSQHPHYAIINETVEACRELNKPHLTGLVNGVLRAASREAALEPTSESATWNHPQWLIDKLRHNWPDHWPSILEANNQPPPMTLRVNARRGSRAAYLEALSDAGIAARATNYSENGIMLESPVAVSQLPGFDEGAVSVQDEAAQLCVGLMDLQPGLRVLDACAAPGGKTCALLEAADDLDVIAIDNTESRLPRIQQNLDRLQLDAQVLLADASATEQWWDGQPFNRILLDVPCSATGVIRRHPDIKLLRRETDITPLAKIQLELLEAMWRILAPGGRVVYATCSVFPQENHRIIQRFTRQVPDATLIEPEVEWGVDTGAGRQLFPTTGGHDGFFYAVLEKPLA